MTLIYNTLRTPEGDPIKGTWIRAKLVASAGFVPADNSEIISLGEVVTDQDGYYEIDLTPNSIIVPEGSVYLVSESNYKAYYILVPASSIPVALPDIITVLPPQPSGAILGASQAYVDQHDVLTLAAANQYTDDELSDLRNEADPFPQYAREIDLPPHVHHNQASASGNWTIVWTYSDNPDVTVYDMDGNIITDGVTVSRSGNTVLVHADIPIAGSADLRG